jgi:hypothetical protein
MDLSSKMATNGATRYYMNHQLTTFFPVTFMRQFSCAKSDLSKKTVAVCKLIAAAAKNNNSAR